MSHSIEKLIIKVGVENGKKPVFTRVPITNLREDPMRVLNQQAVFLSLKGHVPLEDIDLKNYSVTFVYTDADGDDMFLDSEDGLAAAMEEAADHGGKLKLIANVKNLKKTEHESIETDSTQFGTADKKQKTVEGFVVVNNSNNKQPFIHANHQCKGCGDKPIIGVRFVSIAEDGSELSWCDSCQPEDAVATVDEADRASQQQWRRQHRAAFLAAKQAAQKQRQAVRKLKQKARAALQAPDLAASQKIVQEALGDLAPSMTAENPDISEEEKLKRFKQNSRLAVQSTNMGDCNKFLLNALNGGVANPVHEEKVRLNQAARAAIHETDFFESQKLLREVLGAEAPTAADEKDAEGEPAKKQIRHLNRCARRSLQAKDLAVKKELLVKALEGAPLGTKGGDGKAKKALRQAKKAAKAQLEEAAGAKTKAAKPNRPMPRIKKCVRSARQSQTVEECRNFFLQALGDDGSTVQLKTMVNSDEELGRLKQFATAVLQQAKCPGAAKKMIRDALEGETDAPVLEMESLALDDDGAAASAGVEADIVVDPVPNNSDDDWHDVSQPPVAAS